MMRPPTNPSAPSLRVEIRPDVWLDSRLAVWLKSIRVLVVADLHWGYAAAHRARGNLLPLWGDDDLQHRLLDLLSDYEPEEMIWLGDIVHAAEGAAAADAFLRRAPARARITVVAGNHDRRWPGATARSLRRGPYFLHHGDSALRVPDGCVEVIGHHHPAFSWADGAGGHLKVPALVATADRVILPAFSPWAAGVDSRELASADATVWAVSSRRIFAVQLRGRRVSAA